jgi:hypothetical protein
VKIYPPRPSPDRPEGGFTADEVNRGEIWLHADLKCEECGWVASLANCGSIDNPKPCRRCGGKMS